jgi:hypothetical protein
MPIDLVKRFTPTPLTATLAGGHWRMHIETNHALVLRRLELGLQGAKTIPQPSVTRWRIVVEDEIDLPPARSSLSGLGHEGLAFLRIALPGRPSQSAFLAGDGSAGYGVSFVAKQLVEDEGLFAGHYLPAFLLLLREMADLG